MGRHTRNLTLTIAVIAVTVAWPAAASAKQVCWPGVDVPPVQLPALTIPGKEIPAKPVVTIPAITIPAVTIPAVTIPGYTIPARCYETDETEAPPPSKTTVRVRSYNRIDSQFSLALSIAYWRQTGDSSSVPSHAAGGFGEVNAAGHVKNQYVRPYVRSNGTFVPGHWRYGNADGKPTCNIIRC